MAKKLITDDLATLDELEMLARNLKAVQPRAHAVFKRYEATGRYIPLTVPAEDLHERVQSEIVDLLISAVVTLKRSLKRDPSLP